MLDTLAGASSAQRWIPVVGIAIAWASALRSTFARYVAGDDGNGLRIGTQNGWWWTDAAATVPDVAWLGGSLVFALLLVVLARRRPGSRAADIPLTEPAAGPGTP